MYVWFLRWLVAIWVALFAAAAGAWASDTFPGTILSGSSGSIAGTTAGMTGETGEPNFIGGATTSDWYSWTATASGLFTIGTCNITSETVTNTDTTLAAYTGSAVNALTAVGTNDDTTGCNSTVNANYGSFLSFNAVSGTTYRFQVDTYSSGATGTFTLRWGLSALSVAVTDATATEGGDTAAFTVRPVSPPAGSSAVTVTIGASSPASQCTFAPTTLTFTAANFTTPQTVTVTAVNDASAEGTHSCAPATITAAGTGYAGISATPPTITIFDNDNPNFTISKAVSAGSISAPGALTYTITVDNNGTAVLTSPVVTDTLKLGVTTLTPTSGPTLTSGDTNSDGIVQDTETWLYTVTYNVTQANIDTGGSFTNVSTWACAQVAVKTSNTVTTTITQTPNYTIVKAQSSGPSPVTAAGNVIGYSITVANTGNVTLTSPSLTSDTFQLGGAARTLTAGPTLSSGDTDSDGALDVGETWIYAATYTVPQTDVDGTGSYTNQAAYSTTQAGAKTSNTVTTNVTRTASFTNSKAQALPAAGGPITAAGQTLSYTIAVANSGNQTLTGPVMVSDTFQLGGVARTLAAGPSYSSGDTDSDGAIDVGEIWTYTASYVSTQADIDASGSFTNVETFDTAQTAPVTSNTVTTGVTRSPSFTNVKSQFSGPNPVTAAGQVMTYRVTIANTGNQTLTTPVVVSDTFQLGGAARTLSSGPAYASGDTDSDGAIDVGETWLYSATYTTTQADIDGTGSYSNLAQFDTAQTAPVNSNTVTTSVTRSPSFTVAKAKTSGPATITAAGQVLGYTITVVNSGNQTLNGLSISDTFQLGGAARTLTSGPSYASGDTDSDGAIDVGEAWTYAASYTVPQTDMDGTGNFTNSATYDTAQTTPSTTGTVTTNVSRTASFSILKGQTGGPNPITAAGQTITWLITISNTGNQTLTGLSLTDSLTQAASARTLTSGPSYSSGDTDSDGAVDVGEVWLYGATYTVSLSDMNNGGTYSNTATFDTTQTVPTTSAAVTTAISQTATLSIDKSFVITTDGGTIGQADPGDVITYYYDVTNTGNVTMTNISVGDAHSGTGTPPTPSPALLASLNPAGTFQFTATYQVTQGDIDAQ